MSRASEIILEIRARHPSLSLGALARGCGYSRRHMRRFANGHATAEEWVIAYLESVARRGKIPGIRNPDSAEPDPDKPPRNLSPPAATLSRNNR